MWYLRRRSVDSYVAGMMMISNGPKGLKFIDWKACFLRAVLLDVVCSTSRM
jgi:hypothetical protein